MKKLLLFSVLAFGVTFVSDTSATEGGVRGLIARYNQGAQQTAQQAAPRPAPKAQATGEQNAQLRRVPARQVVADRREMERMRAHLVEAGAAQRPVAPQPVIAPNPPQQIEPAVLNPRVAAVQDAAIAPAEGVARAEFPAAVQDQAIAAAIPLGERREAAQAPAVPPAVEAAGQGRVADRIGQFQRDQARLNPRPEIQAVPRAMPAPRLGPPAPAVDPELRDRVYASSRRVNEICAQIRSDHADDTNLRWPHNAIRFAIEHHNLTLQQLSDAVTDAYALLLATNRNNRAHLVALMLIINIGRAIFANDGALNPVAAGIPNEGAIRRAYGTAIQNSGGMPNLPNPAIFLH